MAIMYIGSDAVTNIRTITLASDMIDRSLLYLYTGNEEGYVSGKLYYWTGTEWQAVGTGTGGGGGGTTTDTNSAVISMQNLTGWQTTTISYGQDVAVKVTWSSIEDGNETGPGTVQVIVNGVTRESRGVSQGELTCDLTDYLAQGANSIRIRVTDVYGNAKNINFSVNAVDVTISSTFDDSVIQTGAIRYTYTPVGDIEKTVHFILDGTEIGTETVTTSGRQQSFVIPAQTHGAHKLEVYFDCTINAATVESNHLIYDIICITAGDTTPVISCDFSTESVQQYTTLKVGYQVYTPANLTSEVSLYANDALVNTLTVDRTRQTWAYRADDIGTLTLKITSGGAEKEISLTVTESEISSMAETEGLELYLSSYGRANTEASPGTWKSGDISASLTGFNFTSDGWITDSDGITALRVSGDARVTIPFQPFKEDFRGTGKTIEIEFATRDVMNYDAEIISCMSGGRGFSLSAQLASLASEQSNISMQYKEDEHVRLSFVVEKRAENRLIYVYVNGIMSGAVQYPTSDDFSQTSPVGISIGSNECTTDVYCIRIYDHDLTRTQILDNWIADTQDIDARMARYERNDVYDSYGNVVIAQLPSDLPYMIITAPELPQYKGDKKTVEVTYVDPVSPAKSFTATGVEANVQGTSSQYYPRKNYKMKYKGGFDLTQSGTHVAKYSLTNGAIAVNTFTMKADVASSEGCNNTELVRLYNDSCTYKTPPQEENSAVRQGIDGYPCVIFWNNGTETTFIGKYNFNNDKGTEELYGFADGDESWEILNNTSDRVLWKSDDYESMGTDENGNSVPAWLGDFEARFPDTDPAYTDSTQLKAFAAFLKSTDRNQATDAALDAPVTYGTGDDAVTYTTDSKEYRLAKFKNEVGKYAELESAEFYYLFTEMFLMVDSRAKNAFPSFFGSEVAE